MEAVQAMPSPLMVDGSSQAAIGTPPFDAPHYCRRRLQVYTRTGTARSSHALLSVPMEQQSSPDLQIRLLSSGRFTARLASLPPLLRIIPHRHERYTRSAATAVACAAALQARRWTWCSQERSPQRTASGRAAYGVRAMACLCGGSLFAVRQRPSPSRTLGVASSSSRMKGHHHRAPLL